MRSGPRHLDRSRPPNNRGRLFYSCAAILALAALLMAISLHLPHLMIAGGQAEPGTGHHAMHGAHSDDAMSGESLAVLPADAECHALSLLTGVRPDGDDLLPTGAWFDADPAEPGARRLAPPVVPPLPWPPGPDRQAVFQVYRL